MRKYLIGTIFGFALATAVGANAQEVNKLIDAVVQGVFPVSVDGKSVGDAIVVDNKTYLPVRDFGEAVGYNVTFTENREIVMSKNTDATTTPQPSSKPIDKQIEELNKKIAAVKATLENNRYVLQSNEELAKKFEVNEEDFQKMSNTLKAAIAKGEAQLADYEAQLAALQAQQ